MWGIAETKGRIVRNHLSLYPDYPNLSNTTHQGLDSMFLWNVFTKYVAVSVSEWHPTLSSEVGHSKSKLFHLPTLMHNSLFINNMYVTLLSSTCFEHQLAHLQEDKLYSHSICYHHSLYSTVQYAGWEQTARLQRVTIPDPLIIQFFLLKIVMLMLETCRGF
jgi:hypothetical protein